MPSRRVAIRARQRTSPLTIVRPRTLTSGEASARISARASSGSAPMSVSMTTGIDEVTRPSCRGGRNAQCVDDQAHQAEVVHEVFRAGLRRQTGGDNVVEVLDLVRVGILEGRPLDALLVRVTDR